jgi:hypothetical protein
MLPLDRQRPTTIAKYYEVFDVRPSRGNIEHLTFLKKKGSNGTKTTFLGFGTIRAIIHTCYSIIKKYENNLQVFLISLRS